ncbi:MAG: hypothetical protein LQ350_005991 [Teloschistes chrysophthalmus]|nr:MAG: hypothetical protein LQ350_005991 [Niorma chrysophthalma]
MLDLPKPEDYKIDPSWGIKPGQYIHHVPDKKRIEQVNKYHNATNFVFSANNNELLTTILELLKNQNTVGILEEKFTPSIQEFTASEKEIQATEAQTIPSTRAEDEDKFKSTFEHEDSVKPKKELSYEQSQASFLKSPVSSNQPQKSAKMSAPSENTQMAPYKHRFQPAVSGSQASSEASFHDAPEFLDSGENGTTPDPVSTGEGSGPTQLEAAPFDPYALLGEAFDAPPSITSPETPAAGAGPANDGQASSASKLAKTGGEGAAAAGAPGALWVPPHLRGVVIPTPGAAVAAAAAAPAPAPAPAPAAEEEKAKKAIDWRDVVDIRLVANSHHDIEVPEVTRDVTLQDVYRAGLHDDNREARNHISWW